MLFGVVGLYTFLKILLKIHISVVLYPSTNNILMKVSIAERNSAGNPVADLTTRKVLSSFVFLPFCILLPVSNCCSMVPGSGG